MTDSLRPNVDESSNDGKKNALAPVDESAVQTNVDADDETRATKEDDVSFYNANWFDEDEKETFGQKLKRLLSLFAWSACLTRQDFAAAFGVAFVAVALSILSLSASFATHLADGLQFSFVVLGGLGFLVVHVALFVAALNYFRVDFARDWAPPPSQARFLLTAFRHFALSFVWVAALCLAFFTAACAFEAYDDQNPLGGGLCAIVAWFCGGVGLFGLLDSSFVVARATTRRFHVSGHYVWDADGWVGEATRDEFLLALVNYGVATTVAAFPYALVSALFCWANEEIALGFLAFFACFVISSLFFAPFLLPASAKRIRNLGLDPRATALYLLVPAPYLLLLLIALAPARPKTQAPEAEEEDDDIPF
jgi:hypothetical protein